MEPETEGQQDVPRTGDAEARADDLRLGGEEIEDRDMVEAPRVAFFPDSYHEVNGVAHTSRNFVAYAQRNHLPFLCVRAGKGKGVLRERNGEVESLELGRSRVAIPMERDLDFDLLFLRHARVVREALEQFRPDVIHITGPSELGLLGAYFAHKMGVPLASAWQTNLHEYVPQRLGRITRFIPFGKRLAVDQRIEDLSLKVLLRFYRQAKVIFAPNAELCEFLTSSLGLPCRLMHRGIDTRQFSPALRTRRRGDGELVVGYVGRLSLEKNVGVLPDMAEALEQMGVNNARFLVVGQGAEETYLREHLRNATFAGVLRGQELARAYAEMDVLVFPSHTDTFGNVVLEALGSGVPAVVTAHGGPKHIVRDGVTGVVVPSEHEAGSAGEAALFAEAIRALASDPERMIKMGEAARQYALGCSWDSVFDGVYSAYEAIMPRVSVAAG